MENSWTTVISNSDIHAQTKMEILIYKFWMDNCILIT